MRMRALEEMMDRQKLMRMTDRSERMYLWERVGGHDRSEMFDSLILGLKHEIKVFKWKGCSLDLGNRGRSWK